MSNKIFITAILLISFVVITISTAIIAIMNKQVNKPLVQYYAVHVIWEDYIILSTATEYPDSALQEARNMFGETNNIKVVVNQLK